MAKNKPTIAKLQGEITTLSLIIESMKFDELLTLRNRIKNNLGMGGRFLCLAVLDKQLETLKSGDTNNDTRVPNG